nr:nucleoside hydrolase [Clostridium sp. ATCC 29733]
MHGADGMGDLGTLGEPTLAPAPGHGADALARYAGRGEMELLTLGPLTNVALAIRKHPEAMRKLRHITIMGGAHPYHNPHTVCAEFNIMVDPEAAQIVFSFGVPITLVTLEACGGTAELDDAAMEQMREAGEIGRFCVDCNRTLTELARAQGGAPSLGLPDPAALAVLARPDLIRESFPAHTRVETQGEFTRGATIFCRPGNLYDPAFGDEPAPENSLVVTGLDVAGFHQYLFDRVAL